MKYLNEQIKKLYNITDEDYLNWCKKNDKSFSYKETMKLFLYKIRTGRLVKDDHGNLVVKKPRNRGNRK